MKLTAKGDSRKERPSVSVSVPIDGCFAVAWLQHSETSRRNDLILSAAPPPKTWVALSPSRVVHLLAFPNAAETLWQGRKR
jgi:hypothetical protein